jgi:hypothetical protein
MIVLKMSHWKVLVTHLQIPAIKKTSMKSSYEQEMAILSYQSISKFRGGSEHFRGECARVSSRIVAQRMWPIHSSSLLSILPPSRHWSLNSRISFCWPLSTSTRAAIMRSALPIVGLLGLLTSCASATALTYNLAPNERECFYTNVDKKDAKIAFYFAVQSGGSFDSVYTHCPELCIGRRA